MYDEIVRAVGQSSELYLTGFDCQALTDRSEGWRLVPSGRKKQGHPLCYFNSFLAKKYEKTMFVACLYVSSCRTSGSRVVMGTVTFGILLARR